MEKKAFRVDLFISGKFVVSIRVFAREPGEAWVNASKSPAYILAEKKATRVAGRKRKGVPAERLLSWEVSLMPRDEVQKWVRGVA